MIVQPTAEQTRRVLRKRVYSGPGFGPKSFECLGMGMGLGIGLNSGSSGGFNGQFSSLGWTGLELLFQSDTGLVYDPAAVATAGNTSTTTIAISNVGSTAPCALLVKATNTLSIGSGAQFSIYADGGTTPFMTGVTPTAATPVVLTGVGANVSLTWTAGTSVTNDTWKAAQATWADQASSPHNASASGTGRPIITPGTGGKLGLSGNGTSTRLATTLVLPAAPATTNQYIYLLARTTATPGSTAALCAHNAGTSIGLFVGAGTLNVQQYDGSFANGSVATVNTWYLWEAKFTGSVSDSLKLGSAAVVTGASAGNNVPAGGFEFFGPGNAFFCPVEIALAAISTSPAPAGFRAAVTAWCGVTQV